MCSNPGGGTSQYREGLRLRDLLLWDLDLLLLAGFSRRSLERDLERRLSLERDLRRRSVIKVMQLLMWDTSKYKTT